VYLGFRDGRTVIVRYPAAILVAKEMPHDDIVAVGSWNWHDRESFDE
jgi:hypothetical protein